MDLESIKVEARYSKKFGKNTLRVSFKKKPNEPARMWVGTTGNELTNGDTVVELDALEDFATMLSEAKQDFLGRFTLIEEENTEATL